MNSEIEKETDFWLMLRGIGLIFGVILAVPLYIINPMLAVHLGGKLVEIGEELKRRVALDQKVD
jgi:K+ transporter